MITAGVSSLVPWRALTSLDGRMSRRQFWLCWLAVVASCGVIALVPAARGLAFLVPLWPLLALSVKRLHDLGRPARLAAVPFAVILAGLVIQLCYFAVLAYFVIAQSAALDVLSVMVWVVAVNLLAAVLNLIYLLWIGLLPGQKGPNAYGPDPRAP